MSLPKPPTSLDGSCSVIYENILYSFTPKAFLSLSLEESAKWKKLEMGEKVSGAVCVGTTPGDDAEAGLFVVGGTGGSVGYTGLQKYTYSTGKWTTITPSELITKDRLWHGSTYIKASDTILVYAGSRDGVAAPSGETFTIQASEPYSVNSYGPSSSPRVKPIILGWSDADACLVGGDTGYIDVPLFNPTTSWAESGATLAEPLSKDSGSIQAIMMPGDDGSKSLYTFDLSQSPNLVRRFILQDASGAPLSNSAASVTKRKRNLSLDDWPEYNSTLAPTATRRNFSVAQGADGKVVFSGGNSEVPLAIFDATENSWLDATQLFDAENQKVLSDSTLTSSVFSTTETSSSTKWTKSTSTKTGSSTSNNSDISSALATSTILSAGGSTASLTVFGASASATTDAAGAAAGSSDDDSGLSSNVILGIALGSILGFLALFLLLLALTRRRKARRNCTKASSARHFGNGPRQLLARGQTRCHKATLSQQSYSSTAALIGHAKKQKTSLTRKPSNDRTRRPGSSLHKQLKATISKPVLQEIQPPALQGYDTMDIAFDPTVAEPRSRIGPMEPQDGMWRSSGWNAYWSGGSLLQVLGFSGSKRTTVGSEQSPRYSQSMHYRKATQDSATIPPLIFDFRPDINRVNSSSPVVAEYSKVAFKDGVAGKIERPSSWTSSLGYSSGIPESIDEAWDSILNSKTWEADDAPSSEYIPSFYFRTLPSPSVEGPRNPPTGVSSQPQLAMASTSSDMGWLNLGDRSQG